MHKTFYKLKRFLIKTVVEVTISIRIYWFVYWMIRKYYK